MDLDCKSTLILLWARPELREATSKNNNRITFNIDETRIFHVKHN